MVEEKRGQKIHPGGVHMMIFEKVTQQFWILVNSSHTHELCNLHYGIGKRRPRKIILGWKLRALNRCSGALLVYEKIQNLGIAKVAILFWKDA